MDLSICLKSLCKGSYEDALDYLEKRAEFVRTRGLRKQASDETKTSLEDLSENLKPVQDWLSELRNDLSQSQAAQAIEQWWQNLPEPARLALIGTGGGAALGAVGGGLLGPKKRRSILSGGLLGGLLGGSALGGYGLMKDLQSDLQSDLKSDLKKEASGVREWFSRQLADIAKSQAIQSAERWWRSLPEPARLALIGTGGGAALGAVGGGLLGPRRKRSILSGGLLGGLLGGLSLGGYGLAKGWNPLNETKGERLAKAEEAARDTLIQASNIRKVTPGIVSEEVKIPGAGKIKIPKKIGFGVNSDLPTEGVPELTTLEAAKTVASEVPDYLLNFDYLPALGAAAGTDVAGNLLRRHFSTGRNIRAGAMENLGVIVRDPTTGLVAKGADLASVPTSDLAKAHRWKILGGTGGLPAIVPGSQPAAAAAQAPAAAAAADRATAAATAARRATAAAAAARRAAAEANRTVPAAAATAASPPEVAAAQRAAGAANQAAAAARRAAALVQASAPAAAGAKAPGGRAAVDRATLEYLRQRGAAKSGPGLFAGTGISRRIAYPSVLALDFGFRHLPNAADIAADEYRKAQAHLEEVKKQIGTAPTGSSAAASPTGGTK